MSAEERFLDLLCSLLSIDDGYLTEDAVVEGIDVVSDVVIDLLVYVRSVLPMIAKSVDDLWEVL